MSLQVWLPLNGDLHNQGLANITATNNGATVDNNGKIGKCYNFAGSPQYINTGFDENFGQNDFSISCWIKITENTSMRYQCIIGNKTASGTSKGCAIYYYQPTGKFLWSTADGSIATEIFTVNSFKQYYGKWVHIAMIRNSSDSKKGYFYINGEREELASIPGIRDVSQTEKMLIGSCLTLSQKSYYFTGSINDLRIYDHALSPLEVKHLAQGLVLHYPLNRGGLGPSNLLKNGFGELGSENWSNSSNIFTDVPSGHSEIKKSYRSNESLEFIPLLRNCTYKFSYWVKAANSSGRSYPSLSPYDADKLFISTQNCREGFHLRSMTTLKKQLNPGDTKIYVDDLSAWNANSGHYYNLVAIFSYTDGHGYTWPDGTYTRNCPAFSSGTEAKTNLDKTNNIITLLSAYTGPAMPIGTKVCASTYGSTYFYPSGYIDNSTIADWTYKEGVFSSQNSRLECAKYIRVYAYPNCYQAGMMLSNLTLEDMDNNIEYDVSGYRHNGTKYGTLTYSSDTPRYNTSTVFNGTDNCIKFPFNDFCTNGDIFTMNIWWKKTELGSKNYETLIGGPSGFEMDTRSGSAQTLSLYMAGTRGGNVYPSFNMGEWYMITLVNDGTNELYYVNGVLVKTIEKKNMPTGNYYVGAWQTEAKQNFQGNMSDFKIYKTALSAEDVYNLYAVGASLSDTGVLFSNEVSEV